MWKVVVPLNGGDVTLLHFGKEIGKDGWECEVDGADGCFLQYWFPNDIVVQVPVLDDGTPDSLGEVLFHKKKDCRGPEVWHLERIYANNCSAMFV